MQYNFKQNNSYISTGNLSFIRVQGEESSKQFSVDTTSRHDISTGRTYADAVLKNGELDLFKVSYINSDDIYAIKCDEVYERYKLELENINQEKLIPVEKVVKIIIDAISNKNIKSGEVIKIYE